MTTKSIQQLTSDQAARLAEYRDKWLKIGLSTQKEPLDKERVRELVRDVYAAAKLPAPNVFIYLRSPLAGAPPATFATTSIKAFTASGIGRLSLGVGAAGTTPSRCVRCSFT